MRTKMVSATEQMMLAPAAGAGIGRALAEKLLANPDFLPAMEAAVMGGLRAHSTLWDKEANSGKGGWMKAEDHKTQVMTYVQVLANMEGAPIKRIVSQRINEAVSATDLMELIHASPALASELQRTLDKAAFRTRNVKKAESVELPVE